MPPNHSTHWKSPHPSSSSPIVHSFLLPRRIFNRGLQRRRISTHNLPDLHAVLEDEEGGHGADAELLRDIGDFVDVELDEVDGGVFV
jgi:hypothetical protein